MLYLNKYAGIYRICAYIVVFCILIHMICYFALFCNIIKEV